MQASTACSKMIWNNTDKWCCKCVLGGGDDKHRHWQKHQGNSLATIQTATQFAYIYSYANIYHAKQNIQI